MSLDFDAQISALQTKLEKLTVANGYQFNVEKVERYAVSIDEVQLMNPVLGDKRPYFAIIPGAHVPLQRAIDPNHDVWTWSVFIIGYIKDNGTVNNMPTLPATLEDFKRNVLNLLTTEYESPGDPLIQDVEIQQLTPSALAKEYNDAGFGVILQFSYFENS